MPSPEIPHSPEALQEDPKTRFAELMKLIDTGIQNRIPDTFSKYAPEMQKLFRAMHKEDPVSVGNAMDILMREVWGPNFLKQIGSMDPGLVFSRQQFLSEHGKNAEEIFDEIINELIRKNPQPTTITGIQKYIEREWTENYGHDGLLKKNVLLLLSEYARLKDLEGRTGLRRMRITTTDTNTAATNITNEPHATTGFFERTFVGRTDAGKLLKDPALKNFQQVLVLSQALHLFIPKESDIAVAERANLQLILTITRNLHFHGITNPTENDVRTEHQRLLRLREEYKEVSLFKNRNVLYVVSNELANESKNAKNTLAILLDGFSMGTPEIIGGIRSQQCPKDTFTMCRAERGKEKAEKKKIFELIEHTSPPMTLCLDGHGSIFGNMCLGKVSTPQSNISPEELANSLKERAKKFPEILSDPSKRDIILSSSCFGTNFIRYLSSYMKQSSRNLPATPMPICIGACEYNTPAHYQPGIGSLMHKVNIRGGEVTTIGLIMNNKNQVSGKGKNQVISDLPVIYLPDIGSANGIQQLAEKQNPLPTTFQKQDIRGTIDG